MEVRFKMTKSPVRQQSTGSCFGTPEDDLLQALERNDATQFLDILNGDHHVDVDKVFAEAPCNGRTLLEYACEKQLIQIVKILLGQKGLDVNKMSSRSKMRPIHVAAEKEDATLLELLIDHGADVNKGTDKGKTALHILAANNNVSCLEVLFSHPSSKHVLLKDPLDENKRSPVFLAAANEAEEAVLFLANNGANLRLRSEADDMDTLEMLEDVLPDLYDKLKGDPSLSTISGIDVDNDLWWALKDKDLKKFQDALNKGPNINAFHTDQTCLHYACENGLFSFAELLVKNKADVNQKNDATMWTAVHYAAAIGNFKLLELLDKYGADLTAQTKHLQTPLHLIVNKDKIYANEDSEYEKCLDFLLENDKVNVNLIDHIGNSPLHFAVSNREEETVLKLMRHGADFTKENEWGERPLDLISNQTMNTFFDGCITFCNEKTKDFTITYDYSCLVTENDHISADEEKASYSKVQDHPQKVKTETKVLRHLSKLKHHWQLLKHPLIKSFLHLKWQKCWLYYLANTILYILFVSLLTYYCLDRFSSARVANVTEEAVLENGIPEDSSSGLKFYTVVGVVLFLINTLLAVRETFQFFVAPVRYIFMLENVLEWVMILCLYILIAGHGISSDAQHSLAAACLFLAWVELVLLFGRYRKFSISVSIFLQVSQNFVKLMAWYFVFLLGFIFTFYLLFEPENDFETFGGAVMKTIVMMTGEFDFGEVPIAKHPFVGSVMFLLFLFFVTIVLMNLLTGLAVEDTREIRNNAEIVYQKSQLDLITYIEAMFFGDYEFLSEYPPLAWIHHCFPCQPVFEFACFTDRLQFLVRRTLLFYSALPDMKLQVKPDQHKLLVKTNDRSKLSLSKEILKDTRRLQEVGKDEESLHKRMDKLERKLESLESNTASILSCLEKVLSDSKTNPINVKQAF